MVNMNSDQTPFIVLSKEFVASKQIQLFQGLKQNTYSGHLIFKDRHQQEWIFYLYWGRIVYVTGGMHPVRRWRRHLTINFPQLAYRLSEELKFFDESKFKESGIPWDYYLLRLWLETGKINRETTIKMIRGLTTEVFFDITQAGEITYNLNPQEITSSNQIAMIDSEQQIIEAWKIWQTWQTWQTANSSKFSPNFAPTIIDLEKLQENTSSKTFQALSRLIDGKHSLRDIAVQKQTDALLMTRSINPYLKLGLLDLIPISDLTIPITVTAFPAATKTTLVENAKPNLTTQDQKTLIALVDDNPNVCKLMEQIISKIGYSFVCEDNPLNAIALFLERKPDLIFIAGNLREINGYEVCAQLRQLSCFQNLPIVILCDNLTLIDRVKAKMVGCSELFNQAIETKSIFDTIQKHLTSVTTNSAT